MFLYLIAFVAALLTIFGLPSARNSLRDFSNTGYNQLLEHLLPAFRALWPLRNEELPVDQETPGVRDGGEEERFIKEDILSNGETENAQDISKSMDEIKDMNNKSTESFTFDYKTRRYDSNRAEGTRWHCQLNALESEKNADMVPQDMWNVLSKVPVSTSERRHADSLFEALWQETMKVDNKLQEDDGHNDHFNKTEIIDEATFDKMYEQQNRQVNHEERKSHHHN